VKRLRHEKISDGNKFLTVLFNYISLKHSELEIKPLNESTDVDMMIITKEVPGIKY